MAGTGYTYPVIEGKITTFPDFALNCARAFGALIDMRDAPSDAPIPDQLEPSPYHKDSLKGQKLLLNELRKMTREEIIRHRNINETLRQVRRQERTKDAFRATARLNQMIAEVENWEPPTKEHSQLKTFMLEQLRMSDVPVFDYDAEPLPDPQTYHQQRINEAEKKLEYHRKGYAEEVARTDQRNQWLTQLIDSLKE